MKGGKVINRGSDTCVFSPPVLCLGAKERYDERYYVSRIVSANEDGSIPELENQKYIQYLVTLLKIESSFIFTVQVCTPEFQVGTDFQNISKCNFPLQVNFITPKFEYTLLTVLKRDLWKTILLVLRQKGLYTQKSLLLVNFLSYMRFDKFLNDLVVANSYGIVVNDLHLGNIAISDDTMKAFDFGRSQIISENNMSRIIQIFYGNEISFDYIKKNFISQSENYPQTVLQAIYLSYLLGWTDENHPDNPIPISSIKPLILYKYLISFDVLWVLSAFIFTEDANITEEEKNVFLTIYKSVVLSLERLTNFKNFDQARKSAISLIVRPISTIISSGDVDVYIKEINSKLLPTSELFPDPFFKKKSFFDYFRSPRKPTKNISTEKVPTKKTSPQQKTNLIDFE